MEKVSVKSLRAAVLALILGASCPVQSAQIISLELSLRATDVSMLVNHIPFDSSNTALGGGSVFALQSLPGLTSSSSQLTKDDVVFASAARTDGRLKGMAFPVLMLTGLLVMTSFRQQKTRRIAGQIEFG